LFPRKQERGFYMKNTPIRNTPISIFCRYINTPIGNFGAKRVLHEK
jgi:hypothetical protein